MPRIKLGVAAINTVCGDWRGNRKRILAAIKLAARQKVAILTLPELVVSGYGMEDRFFSRDTIRRAWKSLEEILPEIPAGMVVNIGVPFEFMGTLYNCIAACTIGRVLAIIPKENLASDGIFYEARWFKPWPVDHRAAMRIGAERVPIGEYILDINGIRLAFETCEDAWVHNRPGIRHAARAADIISNSSASPFGMGKLPVRENLVREGSREFYCAMMYSNLLGNESGRLIFDGDCLIASNGGVVARSSRLSFRDFELTTAVVDVEANRMRRRRVHSFSPDLRESDATVQVDVALPEATEPVTTGPPAVAEWERSLHHKEEEVARAVALGLFDYLRKSWSKGFVVSLSGGADSSTVATMCATMVELGVKHLGLAGFKERLSYIKGIQGCGSVREIVTKMLVCIYQGTSNSSKKTEGSARTLAHSLGATYASVSVEEAFQFYRSTVEKIIGRKLTWEEDDIALQNFQPRVRPQIPWGIANVEGMLFLTTSNRTEAAVGYCTMDGDTAGGLNPIGGLDKPFILSWIRFMFEHGLSGLAPVTGLSKVADLQPTAELRPGGGQTDEGDLGPLARLNLMEQLFVQEGLSPVEIFVTVRERSSGAGLDELHEQVRRFFKLLSINQYKRERLAPSFHLDDHNLDPRSFFRHPILSAGYAEELEELDEYVTKLKAAA